MLHSLLAHATIEPANQNRWLLVEFIPATTTTTASSAPQAISGKDVFNALKQSVLVNFGDTGWGEVGGSLAGTFCCLQLASRKKQLSFLCTQSNTFRPRHTFVSFVSREAMRRARPGRRLCSSTESGITKGARSCRMLSTSQVHYLSP